MLYGGAAGQAGQTYFDGAAVGLDVDDVTDFHLLLLQRLINGRVELQLLRSFHCLQSDHHVTHCLAVA